MTTSVASYYAGLPRRVRILVNVSGTILLLFTFSYLASPAKGYWSQPANAYLPDHLRDEYRAYGPEPLRIANRSSRGVKCEWAEVHHESVREIAKVPRVPDFPLLSAWLKPEAGMLVVAVL